MLLNSKRLACLSAINMLRIGLSLKIWNRINTIGITTAIPYQSVF